MDPFIQDLRYAWRGLLRAPGFAAVALLTLAIGIGVNTAMFSVLDAVLLRPLPYRDPARLVMLQQSVPAIAGLEGMGASPLEYLDYRRLAHSFTGIAGVIEREFNLTGAASPERVKAGRVTSNLFPVLGVEPLLGRTFTEEEERYGGPHVAVVSYALWRQRFGGDRGIVGQTIRLDNVPYTVVGVMPASFKFPYEGSPFYEPARLWIPMAFTPDTDMQNRVAGYDVQVVARIRDGVSLSQAQQDIEAARAAIDAEHPDVYTGEMHTLVRLRPLQDVVTTRIRPLVLILAGAVAFVLLIACANVANLLLVRATVRRREIAVRTALGASGARLTRQLLTESVLLALFGGALGTALAFFLVGAIAGMGSDKLPRLAETTIDPRVLAFTLLSSILTGLLFGLAPALRARRVEIYDALKQGGQQTGAGRGRLRWNHALVAFETAAALVLLLGAGLLINSFVRVLRVQPGFDPNGVLIARTAFDRATYPNPAARNAAERAMLARLAAVPGAESVGSSTQLPLADERMIGFHIEGSPDNEFHMADNERISPGYFRTMGIALLRGRDFSGQDRPDSPFAVVINQSMARRFWPGQDALGKRLAWGGRTWFTVVGIAADIKISALDQDPGPTIYMSRFQTEGGPSYQTVFVLRTRGDARALSDAVRNAIWSVDRNLPVYDVRPMTDVVAESLTLRRFTMMLLAGFAAIALLLAAIGLYGVLSYTVAQRAREMGLRMALGATPGDVFRLVLGSGLSVVAVGIAAGLLAGLAASRLLAKLLFGISAVDPLTYAAVAGLLLAVAALAGYIPARRATRTDPMIALRYE